MKKINLILLTFLFSATGIFAQFDSEIYQTAQKNIEKYRKADFSLQIKNYKKADLKNIEVEVEQISHDFLFGCIIFDLVRQGRAPENEALFKERFKQLFNFAVFPFYWGGYEPQQGTTNKENIKKTIDWCIENKITCKGHPLVWTHTAGTPKWLNEFSTPKTKKLLQERVQQIVSGFNNEIEIWDVLNEPVHTVNWDIAMIENRRNRDYRYTGENLMSDRATFIDSCFRWANAANTEATLILNEFNVIAQPDKRIQFYNLLTELKEKETPITGIGIQAHEPERGKYYYSPKQIWETYEKYADFNLPLHITEFIPQSNGDSIKGGQISGVWDEKMQADFSKMFFTLSFGHPSVASINWWGFTDKNTWQEKGGLLDENLQPKPVYKTLDKLINHEWKTHKTGLKPDKNGKIKFHGFRGNYKIIVQRKGKPAKEVIINPLNNPQKIIIEL